MKTHNLKINIEFADAVLFSDKPFEVRNNDRGYQKGDRVQYRVVDNCSISIGHPLNDKTYEITYVLSGWGINEGYVAFGITEIKE